MGFTALDQLKYNTGGPPLPEMLYTEEILRKDFKSLRISLCKENKVDIFEGKYHRGMSSVIRMIADRPLDAWKSEK